MEENGYMLPTNIWDKIGVKFDREILTDKYRRLETIYE